MNTKDMSSDISDQLAKWKANLENGITEEPIKGVEYMLKWSESPQYAELRAALFPISATQPEELFVLLKALGMNEFIGPIAWTMKILSTQREGAESQRFLFAGSCRIHGNWFDCRSTSLSIRKVVFLLRCPCWRYPT